MAGNKVGHYIHGLKDRIWPDFICNFHLFNGRFNGLKHFDSRWHADEVIDVIADRSPLAICVNTSFLAKSAALDHSSMTMIGKFGLVPLASMDYTNKNGDEASCSLAVHPLR